MVNKVILIGHLGGDPEGRSTKDGTSVSSFSVATSRRWKDSHGERQEATEWHNIVAFGSRANVVGRWLLSGSKVYIEGRLSTRSWEDKDSGKKMYRTEVIVESLQMLGKTRKVDASEDDGVAEGYGHGEADDESPI